MSQWIWAVALAHDHKHPAGYLLHRLPSTGSQEGVLGYYLEIFHLALRPRYLLRTSDFCRVHRPNRRRAQRNDPFPQVPGRLWIGGYRATGRSHVVGRGSVRFPSCSAPSDRVATRQPITTASANPSNCQYRPRFLLCRQGQTTRCPEDRPCRASAGTCRDRGSSRDLDETVGVAVPLGAGHGGERGGNMVGRASLKRVQVHWKYARLDRVLVEESS